MAGGGGEIKRREGGGRNGRGERASEIRGCRPRALCCVVYGFPGFCLNSTKTCKMQHVGGFLWEPIKRLSSTAREMPRGLDPRPSPEGPTDPRLAPMCGQPPTVTATI